MKAILVIDMPKICNRCPLKITNFSFIGKKMMVGCKLKGDRLNDVFSERPTWCPLKPMPQKKEVKGDFYKQREIAMDRNDLIDFDKGYNKCIDEILGEQE